MSMKNSNDTIGNQTRNLPTCSALPHQLHYHVSPSNLEMVCKKHKLTWCVNYTRPSKYVKLQRMSTMSAEHFWTFEHQNHLKKCFLAQTHHHHHHQPKSLVWALAFLYSSPSLACHLQFLSPTLLLSASNNFTFDVHGSVHRNTHLIKMTNNM